MGRAPQPENTWNLKPENLNENSHNQSDWLVFFFLLQFLFCCDGWIFGGLTQAQQDFDVSQQLPVNAQVAGLYCSAWTVD